ncbi:transposase [Magnetococcales bacterium HHB-1]
MMKKRKRYTPEEKIIILKRHYLEKEAVSDVCDKADIHPTQFFRWQKTLFEKGAVVFETTRTSQTSKLSKRIQGLEEQLARKNTVLAEVMEEYILCKKKPGEL